MSLVDMYRLFVTTPDTSLPIIQCSCVYLCSIKGVVCSRLYTTLYIAETLSEDLWWIC